MRALNKGKAVALLSVAAGMVLLAAACTGGANAPDFAFTTYEAGQTLHLSDFRGQAVVLNFWAGLCPPCRAEMPDFQKLQQEYAGRLVVIGVDIGPFVGLGSEADGRRLVRELGVSYVTGATRDGQVPVRYNVLGMPTTVFIKRDGEIIQRSTGLLSLNEMRSAVEKLLRQ